jgi:hypothetical protein
VEVKVLTGTINLNGAIHEKHKMDQHVLIILKTSLSRRFTQIITDLTFCYAVLACNQNGDQKN